MLYIQRYTKHQHKWMILQVKIKFITNYRKDHNNYGGSTLDINVGNLGQVIRRLYENFLKKCVLCVYNVSNIFYLETTISLGSFKYQNRLDATFSRVLLVN